MKSGRSVGSAGIRRTLIRFPQIIHPDLRWEGPPATELTIDGEPVNIHSPNGSRDAGIAFIPEDRKRQGLALQMPAYANIALTAAPDLVGTGPFISPRHQISVASELLPVPVAPPSSTISGRPRRHTRRQPW